MSHAPWYNCEGASSVAPADRAARCGGAPLQLRRICAVPGHAGVHICPIRSDFARCEDVSARFIQAIRCGCEARRRWGCRTPARTRSPGPHGLRCLYSAAPPDGDASNELVGHGLCVCEPCVHGGESLVSAWRDVAPCVLGGCSLPRARHWLLAGGTPTSLGYASHARVVVCCAVTSTSHGQ